MHVHTQGLCRAKALVHMWLSFISRVCSNSCIVVVCMLLYADPIRVWCVCGVYVCAVCMCVPVCVCVWVQGV